MLRNLLPSLYRRTKTGKEESLPQRGEDDFFNLMEAFFRAPAKGLLGDADMFPAVDVSETEKEIVINAELPGLDPKDVELLVERGHLVIKGEKRHGDKGERENCTWSECSYGSFQRVIPLPEGVDIEKIKARSMNGVLEVKIPKDEKHKTQRIVIE